jgi:hypothetical protein
MESHGHSLLGLTGQVRLEPPGPGHRSAIRARLVLREALKREVPPPGVLGADAVLAAGAAAVAMKRPAGSWRDRSGEIEG